MNQPLISVIMPVYNAEKYVSDAIKSILKQTYTNFEFIIIDDCSKDESAKVILQFNDSRIKFFRNSTNLGVAKTLNYGLSKSNGKFIARMDADDISVKERFEIQLKEFENNGYLVVGSSVTSFNMTGKYKNNQMDTNNLLTIIDSFFSHPTVMIRSDFLFKNKLNYSGIAEDYSLWTKILRINNYSLDSFKNIKKPLLYYRLSDTQITSKKKASIDLDSLQIRRKALIEFFNYHGLLFNFSQEFGITYLDLLNIQRAFKNIGDERQEVRDLEKKTLFYLIMSLNDLNFKNFPFKIFFKIKFTHKMKFLLKVFFHKEYKQRF